MNERQIFLAALDRDDDPHPLRQRNRAVPRDLETIVVKATAKSRPSRYGTARELPEANLRLKGMLLSTEPLSSSLQALTHQVEVNEAAQDGF